MQQIIGLEYIRSNDGTIGFYCDASIVDLRGKCVPPDSGGEMTLCIADSFLAMAFGKMECTDNWLGGEEGS